MNHSLLCHIHVHARHHDNIKRKLTMFTETLTPCFMKKICNQISCCYCYTGLYEIVQTDTTDNCKGDVRLGDLLQEN